MGVYVCPPTCKMFMSTCMLITLTCNLNYIILHFEINKLHVNIIILHVAIAYLACSGQKYATISEPLPSISFQITTCKGHQGPPFILTAK